MNTFLYFLDLFGSIYGRVSFLYQYIHIYYVETQNHKSLWFNKEKLISHTPLQVGCLPCRDSVTVATSMCDSAIVMHGLQVTKGQEESNEEFVPRILNGLIWKWHLFCSLARTSRFIPSTAKKLRNVKRLHGFGVRNRCFCHTTSLFMVYFPKNVLASLTYRLYLTLESKILHYNFFIKIKQNRSFCLRGGGNELKQRETRIVPYFILLDVLICCPTPTNQDSRFLIKL